jgi:hypothetical protein
MDTLLVGGQLLTLLATVGVSVWGRRNVDDAARVRARTGTSGLDYTMSKNTTLIYAPAIGLLIVVATLAVRDSANLATIASIGLAFMVMLLLAHWSSVRRAAR